MRFFKNIYQTAANDCLNRGFLRGCAYIIMLIMNMQLIIKMFSMVFYILINAFNLDKQKVFCNIGRGLLYIDFYA